MVCLIMHHVYGEGEDVSLFKFSRLVSAQEQNPYVKFTETTKKENIKIQTNLRHIISLLSGFKGIQDLVHIYTSFLNPKTFLFQDLHFITK